MATVNYKLLVDKPRIKVILWEQLTTTNVDGQPFVFSAHYKEKHVQAIGTPGASADLQIQGAADPDSPTWSQCQDLTEDAITFDAAGWKSLSTLPLQVRPYVNAGDGTTDWDVLMVLVA